MKHCPTCDDPTVPLPAPVANAAVDLHRTLHHAARVLEAKFRRERPDELRRWADEATEKGNA